MNCPKCGGEVTLVSDWDVFELTCVNRYCRWHVTRPRSPSGAIRAWWDEYWLREKQARATVILNMPDYPEPERGRR